MPPKRGQTFPDNTFAFILDGGMPVRRSGHFIPDEKVPIIHMMGESIDLRAGVNAVE
jgi:hypothetical protein